METEKPSRPTSDEDSTVHKENGEPLDPVRTISRVPGNSNYYEKNGLRTSGDGEDHDTEPKLTFHRFMILLAFAFLWTGSQIPVYLYGGIYPIIVEHIGGADRYVWILLGNLIPLATVTPFVGALSDLFGRRNLAIAGSLFLIVGNVVCGTANTLNVFIGGQVLNGIGAGILELTALAAAGEIAPTSKRGIYVGTIILTILPFAPSVLYAQLTAFYGSWRYVAIICGGWAAIGLILTAVFYFPPPRVNSSGLSRMEVCKRIDYIGGFLSCAGLTLFLAGLTWGGNQYPWKSAHTLAPLILGLVLIILFVIYEAFLVKYPMFPGRIKTNPRALYTVLIITFVSGANFFSVLVFWPIQYYDMYSGEDPVNVGIGSLPVGFCILGGSVLVAFLVTILQGRIRAVMIISCIIMAAGNGAMAAARLDNLMHIYAAVIFANLGVGAVIIPNQIIATIVCPDDLIATVTALTISVRIIGGSIGFAIYYNILRQKFTTYATELIAPVVLIGDPSIPYNEIYEIGYLLGSNIKGEIRTFPGVTEALYLQLLDAAKHCFELSFPNVYFASIAFGATAVIASLFLPDLSPFMDNHIAVNMH